MSVCPRLAMKRRWELPAPKLRSVVQPSEKTITYLLTEAQWGEWGCWQHPAKHWSSQSSPRNRCVALHVLHKATESMMCEFRCAGSTILNCLLDFTFSEPVQKSCREGIGKLLWVSPATRYPSLKRPQNTGTIKICGDWTMNRDAWPQPSTGGTWIWRRDSCRPSTLCKGIQSSSVGRLPFPTHQLQSRCLKVQLSV